MRKILNFVFIALLSFSFKLNAADLTIDQVTKSVVFLQVPTKNQVNKNDLHIGSGFLVKINQKIFLVTASHVAKKMTSNASLSLGVENDSVKKISLSDLISSRGEPEWIHHSIADVAALKLDSTKSYMNLLESRSLQPSIFISNLEAPPRDRQLIIIGFPLGLGVIYTGPEGKISPITKETKAASGLLTIPRFDNNKPTEFFLLDSPSAGGFSGSPVMIMPAAFSKGAGITFSKDLFFVGLIHGTTYDKTGGKFALVVPSAFVTNTLESAYEKSK